MKKYLFAALAATLSLAACTSQQQADPCLQATDIKQCEAVKQASGGSNNDALMYGALGYMLGSSGGGGRHTTVVQNNHYRPTYYATPKRSSSFWGSSSRSSFSGSSFRSSGFRSSFGKR